MTGRRPKAPPPAAPVASDPVPLAPPESGPAADRPPVAASLPATESAQALGEILAGRGLTQYRAAKLAGTSQPFLNQVATGRRRPSAEWVDLIATALRLSPEESERLHRAAARDHGFRIDLTDRKDPP